MGRGTSSEEARQAPEFRRASFSSESKRLESKPDRRYARRLEDGEEALELEEGGEESEKERRKRKGEKGDERRNKVPTEAIHAPEK